ncbi:MAG: PQ-loop domain-containing transporter [Candidatus Pacearchaeota archaeon]
MALFGGDFGISEYIFQRLNRFKGHLSRKSQKRMAEFIKEFVILFSVAGPIMTLPQVIKIYTEQSAVGLSPITWASYLFIAFFWLAYGVFIKNRPIVLANILWITMHVLIISGIYLYG